MNKQQKIIFTGAYYTFLTSGLVSMLINSVMPYIMDEYQLPYDLAGTLLSLLSVGNLVATFVIAFLIKSIGRKKSAVILSMAVSIGLISILVSPVFIVMAIGFLLIGVSRGSISNINNSLVNDYSEGEARWLNYLHMFYSVGACIAPVLVIALMYLHLTWQQVILVSLIFPIAGSVIYILLPIDIENTKVQNNGPIKKLPYYKNLNFWICCGILFFYVGAENAINGWLVTYLKNSGIMTASYAQGLLSLLYLVMVIGRILGARVSDKLKKTYLLLISAIGALLMFSIFIFSSNLMLITTAIVGIGFFFAPVYPTSIAACGEALEGSSLAMGSLLTMAGFGKIIMPYLVGLVASKYNIFAGMASILVGLFLMVVFILILMVKNKRKSVLI